MNAPDPALAPPTAVILAGGRGTRLGALTDHTPKPLIEVAGRPFLLHVLDYLVAQGIRHCVLATGYRSEDFSTCIGSQHGSLAVTCSREEQPLGTGGALAHAAAQVDDESMLVLNGDTYFPVDLADLVPVHRETGAFLTMVLRSVPDVARFGQVDTEGPRVIAMREKGSVGPGLINGGVYLVDRAALQSAAPEGAFSLERDLLPRWIAAGKVAAAVSGAYMIDIGVPDDLERARRDFAAGTRR